jgi:hypothetical protein
LIKRLEAHHEEFIFWSRMEISLDTYEELNITKKDKNLW